MSLRAAVTRASPFLAACALSLGVSDTGEAQRVPYRACLRVEPTNFGISYGRPAQGQGVVFAGQPLIVELGVANRYEGPRAAAEVDWLSRVSATIRPGGRFDPDVSAHSLTCDVQPSRDYKLQSVGNYLVLEPGGYQFVTCPLGVNRLPAGQYTLVIRWSTSRRTSSEAGYAVLRAAARMRRPLTAVPRTASPVDWMRAAHGC